MPRIPDSVLGRLKLDVACRDVLEARGHQFRKHGADGVVTDCPFHDDRTPSLVVSPAKNLWHCLGACQAGGDVIELVRRLEGVSFRHAVELLLDGLPHLAAEAVAGGVAAPAKRSTVAKLPCPLDASRDDAGLLAQVVDYYHGRLLPAESPGRAYLASRGLDDDDLIRRFRLGLADRSLGLRLPQRNRAEGAALRGRLVELGIYRDSGHEHFNGSVVVPILDEDGAVVELYGRKIRDDLRAGTPKHLYLPGPHRGVWNAAGLREGDGTAIVCEALIDAMTWWVHGLRHATAAYGTGGFTADHLTALRAAKVRDVVLAFDADDAGDAAAHALAERLIADGFTAYRVRLPRDQDVNAAAVAAGADAGALLRDALGAAQWLGGAAAVAVPATPPASPAAPAAAETPAAATRVDAPQSLPLAAPPPEDGVQLRDDGDDVHALIDGRAWRVRGLERAGQLTALKVLLRLHARDEIHLDTIDLYQARQRTAFAAAAAEACGLGRDLVARDLAKLLLRLEGLHEARITQRQADTQAANDTVSSAPEMSEAERADALALLRSDDLLGRIAADLATCGLVGETTNKQLAYLAATSRLLDQPLAVVVQASSAAGKTALMDAVLGCMPEESTRQFTTLSEKALYYLQGVPLPHTILGIRETDGMEAAAYHLKILQSDGVLTQWVPQKDEATGQLVTTEFRVDGPVMLFLTTTAADDDLDPELLNRCLKLSVDESPEQTARILDLQRALEAGGREAARRSRRAIQATHQNAQRLLERLEVRNPFAPQLTFAAGQARLRRDHAKYLALIRAVALLHQHDGRPIHDAPAAHGAPDPGALRAIDVTQRDIATANRLAAAVLGRSLDDLTGPQRAVLEGVHRFVQAAAQADGCRPGDVRFTRRAFRESMHCRWSATQVKMHLDALRRLEYLLVHQGGNGSLFTYSLLWDGQGADGAPFALGLIDADDLRDPSPSAETCDYDHDLSAPEAHLSDTFRPPFGGVSAGFRETEYQENADKTADYWLSQPSAAQIASWQADRALVVPYTQALGSAASRLLPPLPSEVA